MSPDTPYTEDSVISKTGKKTKKPPMYRVLLHNDDYTTMEFVVRILVSVFHKTLEDADRITRHVHVRGMGTAGVYPLQIAETKVDTVHHLARKEEFPLKCSMEPE